MTQTPAKAPCVSDYLACRERYMIARCRHLRLHEELQEALDADSEAGLEKALLQARHDLRHPAQSLIKAWDNSEKELNSADLLFKAAQTFHLQRRAEIELERDIQSLDD